MIKLYNTLTRTKEEFVPITKGLVKMYNCGPTVYWHQHIGNFRAYLFDDFLRRMFEYNDYEVNQIINVTDVGHLTSDGDEGEDKFIKAMKEQNLALTKENMLSIANKYYEAFLEELRLLNIQEPTRWTKATEHVADMISMIKLIEANGYSYMTSVGLTFDTSKFPDYDKLGRLNLDEIREGARGKTDAERKSPSDFALWITNQPNHVMLWDSPWGKGFPGWHIECSAMSCKYLGEQFDIHTGGKEHVQIHHTNEIAQTEAATKKHPWVNYWMHNEWLLLKDGKMSKSSGDIIRIVDLVAKGYDPMHFRYLCLNTHYRMQLTFSYEAMDNAKASYERLINIITELNNTPKGTSNKEKSDVYQQEFLEGINDDLNTSKALAVLWEVLRDNSLSNKNKIHLVKEFDKVLGLRLNEKIEIVIPKEIIELAEKRELARKNKQFDESDKLREEILKKGYVIEDKKTGYVLKTVNL